MSDHDRYDAVAHLLSGLTPEKKEWMFGKYVEEIKNYHIGVDMAKPETTPLKAKKMTQEEQIKHLNTMLESMAGRLEDRNKALSNFVERLEETLKPFKQNESNFQCIHRLITEVQVLKTEADNTQAHNQHLRRLLETSMTGKRPDENVHIKDKATLSTSNFLGHPVNE